MTKILLIGNGAREHAIAEALVRGEGIICAFMSKMNPGIASLCNGNISLGDLNDFDKIIKYAKEQMIDFAIVGPEDPLSKGITDALNRENILVVGPNQKCSQLESSKICITT